MFWNSSTDSDGRTEATQQGYHSECGDNRSRGVNGAPFVLRGMGSAREDSLGAKADSGLSEFLSLFTPTVYSTPGASQGVVTGQ